MLMKNLVNREYGLKMCAVKISTRKASPETQKHRIVNIASFIWIFEIYKISDWFIFLEYFPIGALISFWSLGFTKRRQSLPVLKQHLKSFDSVLSVLACCEQEVYFATNFNLNNRMLLVTRKTYEGEWYMCS